MSPTVLAHLLKLQRMVAGMVTDNNRYRASKGLSGRKTNTSDFYSPLALCKMKWHRP